ncbi:MAG: L,D-transpeptidase [candidate division KSB1 bacterium]|nr:L,D-transpeptidase [candidate division KSB1 bacterium]
MTTFIFVPGLKYRVIGTTPQREDGIWNTVTDLTKLKREITQLQRKNAQLIAQLNHKIPSQPYLVVDTSGNRLYLKSGSRILREAVCSTGSYILLQAPTGKRWIFYTPRGLFRVLGKLKAPVWTKPDWVFVEEGRPIPPKNAPERYEEGVLGEYALSFGNGYLIHGTLYKRLLGVPVTHGCIRLGDEDLRVVYKKLHIGSKIFIY